MALLSGHLSKGMQVPAPPFGLNPKRKRGLLNVSGSSPVRQRQNELARHSLQNHTSGEVAAPMSLVASAAKHKVTWSFPAQVF